MQLGIGDAARLHGVLMQWWLLLRKCCDFVTRGFSLTIYWVAMTMIHMQAFTCTHASCQRSVRRQNSLAIGREWLTMHEISESWSDPARALF